ncbi:hypothetical protein RI129_005019 [Pyrocoelia pectoralis]|uniref:C-type lectin domain-containing protein n=1 Tax=Pyrocoelia pectoralis TaxID=417401 RepID=A0AAN7VDE2_9COLE
MGICLDTEQSNSTHSIEDGQESWFQNSARNLRGVNTPLAGALPMHNNTNVHFESPKVPVIFILGGPGSGKVTHCDNLMQEKKGIIHINMTDLLQQYALGNDMQDFSLLSSKTVTEVLMLEMKMSPNAKTYLISGYPRNMRDVVEYTEKIQIINGAVLISWRQKVLERQIDYGAKLGQVVLSLARMELNNFFKNVMPVADYFDQSSMLVTINGERHPSDVYKDFKAAIMKILGTQDNPPVFSNGHIPEVPSNVATELPVMAAPVAEQPRPNTQVISVNSNPPNIYNSPVKHGWPPVLWVIGGPGSNKGVLCNDVTRETGWAHISTGHLLRAAAESADQRNATDFKTIRDSITAGELVPFDIVIKILELHMNENITANGIIIDGYPRDMEQVTEFEARFKQRPTVILLDCSKLQLGRGRLDDSVTAFRRRLEIFRQSSLPMLKAMDNIGRLTIVDGDTDSNPVKQDFKNVVDQNIEYLTQNASDAQIANGHLPNGVLNNVTENNPIETISKKVQQIGNGLAHGTNGVANGVNHMSNGAANISVPIVWVLGGPGSGKGTQCDRMVAKYGLVHLSSGDLLRNEVGSGSERGKELAAVMERGELVSRQIVLDLLKEAILSNAATAKGFLIDGYPREKEQGELFEEQIGAVTIVLYIDAADDTLVKRLLGRAATSGRADDNEETIKKRLHTFHTHNDAVLDAYKSKTKRINAEASAEEVFRVVEAYLDSQFFFNVHGCSPIRDVTTQTFRKIKECSRSNLPLMAKSRVRTVEQCIAYARSKHAFAFNWRHLDLKSGRHSVNCEILECAATTSSLVNDTTFDYYGIYGLFEGGICIKSLGVFKILKKKVNYTNAIEKCQGFEGDLANVVTSIRTKELSKLLNEKLTDWYKVAYVGLNSDSDEANFVTPEGVPLECFKFRAWGPGQPRQKNTQKCVILDSNSFWKTINCATPLPVLCELFPLSPPSLSTKQGNFAVNE